VRALDPIASGTVDNPDDGFAVAWEAYGSDGPMVVLLPTWMIIHARQWKFQIPFLARRNRVVTFDPRGNGASGRTTRPEDHRSDRFVSDALAVLAACGQERATFIGSSAGARTALAIGADHSDRVDSLVLLAPSLPGLGRPPGRTSIDFEMQFEDPHGWELFTRAAWDHDYERFVEFFFDQCLSEPHSTKAWDDCVGWALETDGATLAASVDGGQGDWWNSATEILDRCRRVRCPTLVVHGTEDRITWIESGRRTASAIADGRFLEIVGGGHLPHARDPVAVNRRIEEFLDALYVRSLRDRSWSRGTDRRRKVLYVSSPIGLGHVRRDIAIADELTAISPGVEIDWLAQHPVTAVLDNERRRVHPASTWLASESQHFAERSCEHDLHAFQALREMDEILVANFHVFQRAVEDDNYDLVVADEAWDIDHFWFENPELKRAPLAWMTDFVGYLPMPSGGAREAFVAADYNAEMIEHVARYPSMRDRAIFVGDPADIVPLRFGDELPEIRAWTEEHFAFAGYISGFDPARLGDRDELRHELGFAPGETVCVVAVGGSGVGTSLLQRAVEAFGPAKAAMPALRMIVVCGPRIDPTMFEARDGLEVVGFVPRLYRHLAACDVAFVQGGLTTTMELVVNRRPFVYSPLNDHFEQQFHVRHRLDRYQAGRCVDGNASPDEIALAIRDALARPVDYRPVAVDGARRAATAIAELLN
jgi:pimeloyl-ACP methyl ester carboxylesterase/predicted glycosyltransferase